MIQKLIVTDLDGTLLYPDGVLPDVMVQAADEVRKRGHLFTVATGRTAETAMPILRDLNLCSPIITHNGAGLFDPSDGSYISMTEFRLSEAQYVISYIQNTNKYFHLTYEGGFAVYEAQLERYRIIFGCEPPLVIQGGFEDLQISKLSILMNAELIESCYLDIKERFPDWYTVISSETSIDIHRSGVNKGAALQQLCDHLGIPIHDAIAFGNYYNDQEMLTRAGIGAAVLNAPEKVLSAADVHIPSCNVHGVASFLEHYFELPSLFAARSSL